MTRDSAKFKTTNEMHMHEIDDLIDDIYDEFEEKIKSILADLHIDGHTKRGMHNTIAMLEEIISDEN